MTEPIMDEDGRAEWAAPDSPAPNSPPLAGMGSPPSTAGAVSPPPMSSPPMSPGYPAAGSPVVASGWARQGGAAPAGYGAAGYGGAGPRITLPPGMRPAAVMPPAMPRRYPPPVPAGAHIPSGLFPSGPPRPHFREAHQSRPGPIMIGIGAGLLWMLLFGLMGSSIRGYVWWSVAAGVVAWAVALTLSRLGDRGVAVGVALSSGLGVAIAGSVVFAYWLGGNWLLW